MLKKLGILVTLSSLLSACSYFNMNKNQTEDQMARCKELKRQMIFNNPFQQATSNQVAALRTSNSAGELQRSYHDEGCD